MTPHEGSTQLYGAPAALGHRGRCGSAFARPTTLV